MKSLRSFAFRSFIALGLASLLSLSASTPVCAAEYQWSVSIAGVPHDGLDPDYPRAFLWIPPNCKQVRGLVLSQNNMQEQSILEDAGFRKTLADLGFAEIWITPNLGTIHFRFDQGQDQILLKTLKDLATISGYQEIENVPWVTMGHSATAGWGWDIAAWKPERTLAVISLSGQWPYYKDTTLNKNNSPDWGDRTVDGVPGLTTKGEYEIRGDNNGWYFHLKDDQLTKHPKTVFTQVVEPGGGHFDATKAKMELIELYIRKAVQYRLPTDQAPGGGPVTLTPIDPTTTGWLFDEWRLNQPPTAAASPVADYKGKRDEAFWAFDEEMVKAIEDFQSKFRNQPAVLIGYKQKDGLRPPAPNHGMVHLKFEPEDDGVTFKLTSGFWDAVPPTSDGKGSEWAGWLGEGKTVNQRDAIPHPDSAAESQITITPIVGPVIQTAPDTFVIHPYRIGTHDMRKSNDIWLAATWPGNDTYKGMVQQAELQFPMVNHTGNAQTITFPEIRDQVAGTASVKLDAKTSADLPVSYYVREGPAEVSQDGTLTFTPIPPRSKYPIAVTVVATQWGRSIDPKLQTADPVERTFSVTQSTATNSP